MATGRARRRDALGAPHCVGGHRVLTTAGANQEQARWTDVNAWSNHLEKVATIEASAARHPDRPSSLAEWELWAFEHG